MAWGYKGVTEKDKHQINEILRLSIPPDEVVTLPPHNLA